MRKHSPLDAGLRLHAEGLRVARGRRVLADGVDLELRRGEVLHVAGENGCGKSSLLRVLAGDVEPRRGRVARASQVAYVPERMALPDALPARRWLALFGAGGDALPADLDRHCGLLSKGQLQRVALTAALRLDAELVVLDEPWSGLDGPARHWLEQELLAASARGAAIIFTDHSGTGAPIASGRLVLGDDGPPRQVACARAPVTEQVRVVLVRGGVDREVVLSIGERDRFIGGALAEGWGVERVEPVA